MVVRNMCGIWNLFSVMIRTLFTSVSLNHRLAFETFAAKVSSWCSTIQNTLYQLLRFFGVVAPFVTLIYNMYLWSRGLGNPDNLWGVNCSWVSESVSDGFWLVLNPTKGWQKIRPEGKHVFNALSHDVTFANAMRGGGSA
jgi:hypothetical protein